MHVEGGRITGVSPSRNHPVNEGTLCVKGWNAHEFVQHPDRLRHPMIREDGELRRATWAEAIRKVADNFTHIREVQGPDSIGVLSSAKCTNEENYLMMKFARAVMGTNNVDHCARLCHSSTVGGLAAAFGSGAMTNSISEIREARVLFVIGSNTTEQHPMIAKHMLQSVDRGSALIVADPRETQIARFADIHLRHRCGTDVPLLLSIINVIVTDGLVDTSFVRKRTENFDEFEKVIMKYTPEAIQKTTGVDPADVRRAARIYATEKRSMLFYSMGITQHVTGVDNVRACADLVMLTGHIGLPMTGLNPLRGQNNVQGACDMGALPNVYSGYQSVADPKKRRKFERAWKRKLPTKPGQTLTDMTRSKDIRALYVMGENPALSDADTNHIKEFLDGLDFLVVQDIFLSETSEYANIVLPAASYAEKDGSFTNTDRRVQLLRQAVKPPGEARPDWEIICEIATRMGYDMHYRGTYEIMEEIALLTPSYGGTLHHRLNEEFGIQWPCHDSEDSGTPYLHRKKFARGLGSFMTVGAKPPAELPDDEYPFVLTTGRIYFQFHTGTMTRRTYVIEREEPECVLEINPADADSLGVRDGSPVRVKSRRGQIDVKAKVTQKTPEGTVFLPFHYREAAANVLTNPVLDPEAKIPEFKVCAVSLEAI
jgi:formate dehydrogenase alpha subunit